ncbi:MAG: NUDIX domain-containing protein [Reyranella sp.]|uniref:NUDIX domain-containing protein n=1 Tax=Reyranella sp. TaxID=1929291 RepID=UPI001AC263CE|nr:NUDIX domain-containing protein [Reyranella sp.]
MKKRSAGILAWRRRGGAVELFLVHPGGPFWKNKDDGAWSIPKGEIDPDEEPLKAAQREFAEETGQTIDGTFTPLDPVKIASGKTIEAWAIEHDLDASSITSNTFEIEWPPRSGKRQAFPEVDRAAWFDGPTALRKITPGQVPLLVQLLERLGVPTPPVPPPRSRTRSGTAARRTAGPTRRR